jgi:UDP-GlcNAc:undecaprenyl-phosphate GlcNAc-1-phosphate transferase
MYEQPHNWILYIAVFASAFGIALLATPMAKTLSIKFGAIDYPKKRGMHKDPIPRMGGIAIVLGFMLTMTLIAPFMGPYVPELMTTQFIGFMVGAMVIVIVGILDDIYTLRARTKLAFQVVAALIVIFTDTQISFVMWPFAANLDAFAVPVTLIWIIGVTNAVNLIDGVDGLAAGVSSIAALCLTALCVLSGSPLAVVLSATLAGSCLGFLPRNFSPAEVIMGDTGALFLGYVLAVSSVMGVFKSYAVLSIVIACFALALPIFDTMFAMIRRLIRGKPIMSADRGHLHHRLIDAGLSPSRAVLTLYGLSLICAVIAFTIALDDLRVLLIVVVFIFVFAMMLFVYRKRLGEKKQGDVAEFNDKTTESNAEV